MVRNHSSAPHDTMESMNSVMEALAQRIRTRALPEAVVTLALHGGAAVHPALDLHAEHIELTGEDPTSAVIAFTGREDLVPLWMSSATETVFSAGNGSFELWSAEDDAEPWERWPDFVGAVRYLLTDLWEFEVTDEQRREVAALLLPPDRIAAALVPEER
ncbi:hypothetical protein JD276_14940 [Leucobacter sp. CSA1]|uniref:Uncharacterized protein n=1 Tax=Leucobacter chromiisoli TaxID=2796471 RepID=A0A934QBM8_9MICO|nr:hypothetical protein [Leucobacter chromiisoli]MBK0420327.1 hypothetical protein [Leucobacter chromiisoli]